MQVRIEDVSPVEKKLIVEVPWATVNDRLSVAFKELGRTVQLKGFRKGKVPKSVLESMFGRRVRAEVAGQLVQESFVSAVGEHKLEVVSQPMVKDAPEIKKGEPFAFEAIVEIKGEVEVDDYRSMELKKRVVEIGEEAVDKALEQLQREHTELRPVEGRDVLAASDFVALSAVGTVGDKQIEQPQLTIDLGEPKRAPIPGLVNALIGAPVATKDETVSYEISKDDAEGDLVGQKVELKVSVVDVREKDVPKIDDELAKDTGEAETLEELRGVLAGKLKERMEDEVQAELRESALAELVKRNQIPIAESLVERAAAYKEQRFRSMLGMAADDEHLTDDLREKLREGADDEVRGQLLVDAVGQKEEITVSDTDIDEHLSRTAKGQGTAVTRMRAEMERDGRLDNLRYQLLSDKVLDFIIDRSVVTEYVPEVKSEAEKGTEGGSEPEETADAAPAEDAAEAAPGRK